MKFATVDDLKRQLNIEIDTDSNDKDELRDGSLQLFLDAAKERIETMLNLELIEDYPDGYEDWSEEEKSAYSKAHIVYNSQIKLAQMLIAADFFAHREETSPTSLTIVPIGARDILSSIRRWNA